MAGGKEEVLSSITGDILQVTRHLPNEEEESNIYIGGGCYGSIFKTKHQCEFASEPDTSVQDYGLLRSLNK